MNQSLKNRQRVMSMRSEEPLTFDRVCSVIPLGDMSDDERIALRRLALDVFRPFMVYRSRPADGSKQGGTTHLYRLRHDRRNDGPETPEIVLVFQRKDRASDIRVLSGLYRSSGGNNLICGLTDEIRIPDQVDRAAPIVEAAIRILDGFERVDTAVARMKSVFLSEAERAAFARESIGLRYTNPPPIGPSDALTLHRADDAGQDVWRTFNVVRENLIRGGIRGTNGQGKRYTIRAVTGIGRSIRLNRQLWNLAMKTIERKQAA